MQWYSSTPARAPTRSIMIPTKIPTVATVLRVVGVTSVMRVVGMMSVLRVMCVMKKYLDSEH